MHRILNVHLVPEMANPHDLAGHTSVVIDVLRASTTITTALNAGAEAIVPCLTVEEARQLAGAKSGSLLGGERGGVRVQGFDFGNSPAEYSSDRVRAKTIIFTTTNGTKALTRCMGAGRVLLAALVNRAAVCSAIAEDPRVDLICAGTDGEFSFDDAVTAGAIVDNLVIRGEEWQLSDAARICRCAWQSAVGSEGDRTRIVTALENSSGGRNLIALGMEGDLKLASQLDQLNVVPELDRSTWQIRK
jgi:2-phosphosulfolactate phosphatase